jgi:hypothetical protein
MTEKFVELPAQVRDDSRVSIRVVVFELRPVRDCLVGSDLPVRDSADQPGEPSFVVVEVIRGYLIENPLVPPY